MCACSSHSTDVCVYGHLFCGRIQLLVYVVAFICEKVYTLLCSLGLLLGLVYMLFELFDLLNEVSDLYVIARICV